MLQKTLRQISKQIEVERENEHASSYEKESNISNENTLGFKYRDQRKKQEKKLKKLLNRKVYGLVKTSRKFQSGGDWLGFFEREPLFNYQIIQTSNKYLFGLSSKVNQNYISSINQIN